MERINKGNPGFPEVQETQNCLTIGYGDTEVIQTNDSVRIQVRCKSRLDFAVSDD